MKQVGFSRMALLLENKLKINFYFKTSHVYTISNSQYNKLFPDDIGRDDNTDPKVVHGVKVPKWKSEKSTFGYLIIDSTFELEKYDRITEGSVIIRPQLLAIFGILTLFTQKSFTPFQNVSNSHYLTEKHLDLNHINIAIHIDGVDKSKALEKLLNIVQNANESNEILILSLIERWRKALYLEEESEESLVHYDESILAYFHILEVLSDEFQQSLKTKIDQKKLNLIDEILKVLDCDNNYEHKKSKLQKSMNIYADLKI